MAPPAPPAITCEMMPSTLRLPDCAAAVIAGSNKVTIWPSTPPPTKPEIMLPIIPRSKVGDDLTYGNATKRPSNQVDQNLFHVDLPALRLTSRLSRNDLGVEFPPYSDSWGPHGAWLSENTETSPLKSRACARLISELFAAPVALQMRRAAGSANYQNQ